MKGKLLLALSLMLVALAIAIGLTRAEGLTSHNNLLSTTLVGSAFTYQGQLKTNGTSVNSVCDFRFSLWDSLGDVTGQIGITQTRTSIAVTNGLLTINDLDFGASAFNGDARWLQIDVRCPTGIGSYATLTPRQSITAVPYSQYSRAADLLDGQHANAFAAAIHTHSGDQITSTVATATLALSSTQASWSGLTGVPIGFADGIDNVAAYTRTMIVSPVGTAAQNGAALLNALANITDASANNSYLLKIEPGVYDLITSTLFMKPYIDIEGSGELVTTITAAGSTVTSTGTMQGANNTELRFLTVKSDNTGYPYPYATAIYNDSASPRLLHVTAVATGAGQTNFGVYNHSSSPIMADVRVAVSGSFDTYGVYNRSASPTMTNVAVDTRSDGGLNYGVYNESSSPAMDVVSISVTGGTNLGSTGMANDASSPMLRNVNILCNSVYCVGVWNRSSSAAMNKVFVTLRASRNAEGVLNSSSSPTMNDVVISVQGFHPSYGVNNVSSSLTLINSSISCSEAPVCYGMYNDSSSAAIQNSTFRSLSAGHTNYGIYNTGGSETYTVTIDNSQLTGSTNTIWSDAEFTTLIGTSQLNGGAVITNSGTITCAGVYDENYTFYGNTCP